MENLYYITFELLVVPLLWQPWYSSFQLIRREVILNGNLKYKKYGITNSRFTIGKIWLYQLWQLFSLLLPGKSYYTLSPHLKNCGLIITSCPWTGKCLAGFRGLTDSEHIRNFYSSKLLPETHITPKPIKNIWISLFPVLVIYFFTQLSSKTGNLACAMIVFYIILKCWPFYNLDWMHLEKVVWHLPSWHNG